VTYVDAEEHDNDLKWLMDHSHNAYLAWIALWLACLLGIGNILITIILKPDVLISLTHKIIVFILYWSLVGGMIFSVCRVSNVIRDQIVWANQIEREFLRREILSHRGRLATFIIDNNGNLCTRNRNLVILVHVIVAVFLFLPFPLAL
jgi:hypothetical protein